MNDYYQTPDPPEPQPGAPGDPAYGPPGDGPRRGFHAPPPTSRLAVASIPFGIFCPFVGLILGIVALVKINNSQGRLGGGGLAIGGIVTGGLMTVAGVPMLAIVAAIAIPGLMRSRVGANETNAIGSMKCICTGQEQFRSQNQVDQDNNGVGEYGFMTELAGGNPPRGSDSALSSPFIPSIFGTLNSTGAADKAGYCFKIFLPSTTGLIDDSRGVPPSDPDSATLQEETYLAMAWPRNPGRTGMRMFLMTEQGIIYASRGSSNYNDSNPPDPNTMFKDENGDGVPDVFPSSLLDAGWVKVG